MPSPSAGNRRSAVFQPVALLAFAAALPAAEPASKIQPLDSTTVAVTDFTDAELLAAVEAHRETIAAETLAEKLESVPGAGDVDVNGHLCALELAKI